MLYNGKMTENVVLFWFQLMLFALLAPIFFRFRLGIVVLSVPDGCQGNASLTVIFLSKPCHVYITSFKKLATKKMCLLVFLAVGLSLLVSYLGCLFVGLV